MAQKKKEETPFGVMSSDFNCENLYLEKEDILDLKEKIENDNLPFAQMDSFGTSVPRRFYERVQSLRPSVL